VKENTMRTRKLLTLAATAVAAACSGISPTSPGATVSSDQGTALTGAQASAETVRMPLACRSITEVQLLRLPTRDVRVRAVYLRQGEAVECTLAPSWISIPAGRIGTATTDKYPFVVKVFTDMKPAVVVRVTAQAPNGVQGAIEVGN
jgi:hypothetical protein